MFIAQGIYPCAEQNSHNKYKRIKNYQLATIPHLKQLKTKGEKNLALFVHEVSEKMWQGGRASPEPFW